MLTDEDLRKFAGITQLCKVRPLTVTLDADMKQRQRVIFKHDDRVVLMMFYDDFATTDANKIVDFINEDFINRSKKDG